MRVFNTKTVIVLGIALTCLVAAWNWRLSEPKLLLDAREITFDTYQRLKPRRALGQPIRIIDIDEAAIAKYGQWPWPRTQMAEMLDRLRELGALTVAFDMVFSERDRTGPTGFIRQLQERDWPGRASLEAMVADIPDNDADFAQSITKLPTVL